MHQVKKKLSIPSDCQKMIKLCGKRTIKQIKKDRSSFDLKSFNRL